MKLTCGGLWRWPVTQLLILLLSSHVTSANFLNRLSHLQDGDKNPNLASLWQLRGGGEFQSSLSGSSTWSGNMCPGLNSFPKLVYGTQAFPPQGCFLLPFPHQPPINSLFKDCVGSLSCFPGSIVQSLLWEPLVAFLQSILCVGLALNASLFPKYSYRNAFFETVNFKHSQPFPPIASLGPYLCLISPLPSYGACFFATVLFALKRKWVVRTGARVFLVFF